MKYIYFFIFILFFAGCTSVKTEFVQSQIPDIHPQPQYIPYELKLIEINNKKFYSLTEKDAKNLSENWINYKAWAEYNFEVLKSIKEVERKTKWVLRMNY